MGFLEATLLVVLAAWVLETDPLGLMVVVVPLAFMIVVVAPWFWLLM